MWGNTLGWWISALLVLVTASLIGWVQFSSKVVTARTEFSRDSAHGAAIALPVAPKVVLPSMTDSADAGDVEAGLQGHDIASDQCLRAVFDQKRRLRMRQAESVTGVMRKMLGNASTIKNVAHRLVDRAALASGSQFLLSRRHGRHA